MFQQETLSSSNTDVIFLGSIDIIIRRDKNEHHASAMDQLKGFRTFAMRTLLRAAHCLRRIQQHEHFVSLAVRAPLWAAHCRVASDCPSPSLPCNAWLFFSIGLLVLIGLCFFYRLETSAPGLSGYYWYIKRIKMYGEMWILDVHANWKNTRQKHILWI